MSNKEMSNFMVFSYISNYYNAEPSIVTSKQASKEGNFVFFTLITLH